MSSSQSRRRVIRVAALLAFLTITSCNPYKVFPDIYKTYSGPPVPEEQIGFLQVIYDNGIGLAAVDNVIKYKGKWAYLAPGLHWVTCDFYADDLRLPVGGTSVITMLESEHAKIIEFTVRPGRRYRIVPNVTHSYNGYRWEPKIIEY